MVYDLLIDEAFPEKESLKTAGYNGVCIESDDFELIREKSSGFSEVISCYTRRDVPYSNKIDQAAILRLRKYNLVCINTDSVLAIPSIIKLGADLIRIDLEAIKHLRKNTAGMLRENNLYVELVIKHGMGTKRVLWMRALRRLLRLRFGPILVISSGATGPSELRSEEEVARMLLSFGLGKRAAKKIVDNSEKVLRLAALKRYTYNSAVATLIDESNLKRDFILNEFQ